MSVRLTKRGARCCSRSFVPEFPKKSRGMRAAALFMTGPTRGYVVGTIRSITPGCRSPARVTGFSLPINYARPGDI